MTNSHNLLFSILILALVNAAPSDRKEESTDKTETELSKSIEPVDSVDQPTENTRQKRWYNFQGYGFPPMNPIMYPNYDSSGPGFTSSEQHFLQIHNRLREITSQIRNLSGPPFGGYIPVLFIPQYVNCGCGSTATTTPPPNIEVNDTALPESVDSRFPEMEDTRQNWGFVMSPPNDNIDYSRRPINLEPFIPDRPLSRPPPPVEHGSVQADSKKPPPPPPPPGQAPPSPASASAPNSVGATQEPMLGLTVCDDAIVTCCHRPEVTYDCFTTKGCPPATMGYDNPCDPEIILSVVDKYKEFYRRKSGR